MKKTFLDQSQHQIGYKMPLLQHFLSLISGLMPGECPQIKHKAIHCVTFERNVFIKLISRDLCSGRLTAQCTMKTDPWEKCKAESSQKQGKCTSWFR